MGFDSRVAPLTPGGNSCNKLIDGLEEALGVIVQNERRHLFTSSCFALRVQLERGIRPSRSFISITARYEYVMIAISIVIKLL